MDQQSLLAHIKNTSNIDTKFIDEFGLIFSDNSIDYKKDLIIDMDKAFSWIGYSQVKDVIKVIKNPKNNLVENMDYKIVEMPRKKTQNGGRAHEKIIMTIFAFKNLCLKAIGPMGIKVRTYLLELENYIQKNHTELLNNFNNPLTQLNQFNLDQYKDKEVVYLLEVKKETTDMFIYKFGITKDIVKRLINHKKTFKNIKIIKIWICENRAISIQAEKNISDYVTVCKIKFEYKSENELFKTNDINKHLQYLNACIQNAINAFKFIELEKSLAEKNNFMQQSLYLIEKYEKGEDIFIKKFVESKYSVEELEYNHNLIKNDIEKSQKKKKTIITKTNLLKNPINTNKKILPNPLKKNKYTNTEKKYLEDENYDTTFFNTEYKWCSTCSRHKLNIKFNADRTCIKCSIRKTDEIKERSEKIAKEGKDQCSKCHKVVTDEERTEDGIIRKQCNVCRHKDNQAHVDKRLNDKIKNIADIYEVQIEKKQFPEELKIDSFPIDLFKQYEKIYNMDFFLNEYKECSGTTCTYKKISLFKMNARTKELCVQCNNCLKIKNASRNNIKKKQSESETILCHCNKCGQNKERKEFMNGDKEEMYCNKCW